MMTVLSAGHVTPARAADAEEAGATEANALIDQGIALRRNGDDAAALPLFQQAEQLDPSSTRVMVHLAATYQALGEWEQADRYLTRALRDPNDAYVQKHQSTLATARRAVDAHIARLRLLGGPPGTEVRLNGKLIGKLPMTETVRIEAGIYTLEASLPGHYPVTRSVALAGGALAQETVELAPRESQVSAEANVVPLEREPAAPRASSGSSWLAWTFGGLALGAAGATVYAWAKREEHAKRWNDDDRCLGAMLTRGQRCGDEKRDGDQAERWMWIGGAATVAFSAAAIGTLWLGDREDVTAESALSCGVALTAVQCAGSF